MKKNHLKKAFTLVEVLLAIFILEIGLLGIAGFYASSFKIIKTARNETIASNLAAGVLEEELAIAYGSLANLDRDRYSSDPNNAFYNWYRKVEISCINSNLDPITCDSNAHMKKIVVTIYWQEQQIFQIATIKAEH